MLSAVLKNNHYFSSKATCFFFNACSTARGLQILHDGLDTQLQSIALGVCAGGCLLEERKLISHTSNIVEFSFQYILETTSVVCIYLVNADILICRKPK